MHTFFRDAQGFLLPVFACWVMRFDTDSRLCTMAQTLFDNEQMKWRSILILFSSQGFFTTICRLAPGLIHISSQSLLMMNHAVAWIPSSSSGVCLWWRNNRPQSRRDLLQEFFIASVNRTLQPFRCWSGWSKVFWFINIQHPLSWWPVGCSSLGWSHTWVLSIGLPISAVPVKDSDSWDSSFGFRKQPGNQSQEEEDNALCTHDCHWVDEEETKWVPLEKTVQWTTYLMSSRKWTTARAFGNSGGLSDDHHTERCVEGAPCSCDLGYPALGAVHLMEAAKRHELHCWTIWGLVWWVSNHSGGGDLFLTDHLSGSARLVRSLESYPALVYDPLKGQLAQVSLLPLEDDNAFLFQWWRESISQQSSFFPTGTTAPLIFGPTPTGDFGEVTCASPTGDLSTGTPLLTVTPAAGLLSVPHSSRHLGASSGMPHAASNNTHGLRFLQPVRPKPRFISVDADEHRSAYNGHAWRL